MEVGFHGAREVGSHDRRYLAPGDTYIFIAPEDPSAIGEIAQRVYRKHYRRAWNADARGLWLLAKILDAGADAMHGELLSYVFFAGEFAEELICLGQADACRWIDEHPTDLWQLDPLPDWSPAPNGASSPSPSWLRSDRLASRGPGLGEVRHRHAAIAGLNV